jgi:hypothetical protein
MTASSLTHPRPKREQLEKVAQQEKPAEVSKKAKKVFIKSKVQPRGRQQL